MRYAPRLAAVLLLAVSTIAAAAQIKDDAGFFSPDAVQKADAKLAELKNKYQHTVAIETYAELPVELRGKVDGNDASAQRAYNTYGAMRANALAADVYVLIVRNPAKLEVTAANSVARSGLTPTDRDGLRQELLTGFRAKRYDDALVGMTASLERTYANLAGSGGNAPAAQTPPGGWDRGSSSSRTPTTPTPAPPAQKSTGLFGGLGCIGLVVIGVVILLVISLIRRMFGGNRQAGYGGQVPPGYGQGGYGAGGYGGGYPPPSGGGFGRGMAGGLLGGLFGSWLGGNVFGQSHHTSGDTGSVGHDPNTGYGGGNDANTGGDATGFSTSGGDFGSSGDTGGNDFSSSGGDFGGGGGDSGGGGGGGGDF